MSAADDRGARRTSAIRPVLVVGALAAVALMYRAGHRNPSVLLIAMFAVWVLAPFVIGAVASRVARAWSRRSQAFVDRAVLVVALGSVCVYVVDAVRPLGPKPAFIYLFVPLVSSVLLVMAAAIAARRSVD